MLEAPHAFALERVGFAYGRWGGGGLVLLSSISPVADEDYEYDASVAARIGAAAISKALQFALKQRAAAFHVHIHPHAGLPRFSRTDIMELPGVIDPFRQLIPEQPHGLLLLSHDRFSAVAWFPDRTKVQFVNDFTIVGAPMVIHRSEP